MGNAENQLFIFNLKAGTKKQWLFRKKNSKYVRLALSAVKNTAKQKRYGNWFFFTLWSLLARVNGNWVIDHSYFSSSAGLGAELFVCVSLEGWLDTNRTWCFGAGLSSSSGSPSSRHAEANTEHSQLPAKEKRRILVNPIFSIRNRR